MTTEIPVVLRLEADSDGMVTGIRVSGEALEQLRTQAGQVNPTLNRTERELNQVETAARRNKQATDELRGSYRQLRNAAATLGIGLLAREVVRTGNAFIGYEAALTAVTGSQQAARVEIAFLREEADRLGLNFQGLVGNFTRLSAAAESTNLTNQQTREIFSSLSESLRVFNATQEESDRAFRAFEQILSKGTVTAEELRGQLGDVLPGAFSRFAESIGVSTEELNRMLERGEVIAEDTLPLFAERLREVASAGLEAAQASPAAEFQRLGNAITDLENAIAQAGFLEALAEGARTLIPLVELLGENLDVLGGLIIVLAATRIPALVASLVTLATTAGAASRALTLLGGPLGILAGVTTATVLLTDAWIEGQRQGAGYNKILRDQAEALTNIRRAELEEELAGLVSQRARLQAEGQGASRIPGADRLGFGASAQVQELDARIADLTVQLERYGVVVENAGQGTDGLAISSEDAADAQERLNRIFTSALGQIDPVAGEMAEYATTLREVVTLAATAGVDQARLNEIVATLSAALAQRLEEIRSRADDAGEAVRAFWEQVYDRQVIDAGAQELLNLQIAIEEATDELGEQSPIVAALRAEYERLAGEQELASDASDRFRQELLAQREAIRDAIDELRSLGDVVGIVFGSLEGRAGEIGRALAGVTGGVAQLAQLQASGAPELAFLSPAAGIGSLIGGALGTPQTGSTAGSLGGLAGFGLASTTGGATAIGGALTSLFGSGAASATIAGFSVVPVIGTIVGALVAGLLDDAFGDAEGQIPRIRVANNQLFAEQDRGDPEGIAAANLSPFSRRSALGVTIQGQRITEALDTGPAQELLDQIARFDEILSTLPGLIETYGEDVRQALLGPSGESFLEYSGDFTLDEILEDRFGQILGGLPEAFSRAVSAVGGDLDQRIGSLGELLGIDELVSQGADLFEGTQSFDQVVDFLLDAANAGETIGETYARLGTATELYRTSLELLGVEFEGSTAALITQAADIAAAAGGIERASQLFAGAFSLLFTAEEQAQLARDRAQASAASEFADIGLDVNDFTGQGGVEAFREIFDEVFPTLSAEAQVEFLEAANALGFLIDRERELTAVRTEAFQPLELSDRNDAAGIVRFDGEATEAGVAVQELLGRLSETSQVTERLTDAERELLAARAAANERLDEILGQIDDEFIGLSQSPVVAQIARLAQNFDTLRSEAEALGASTLELARIDARFAAELNAIVDQLETRIAGLVDQLFGDGGARDDRIAELEQREVAAIQAVSAASDSRYRAEFDAINRLRQLADDLLIDDNLSTLNPRGRLEEARSQFEAALAAGDQDRVADLARPLLDAGREFFASSEAFSDLFDFVQGALRSLEPAAPVDAGAGTFGGTSGGGVVPLSAAEQEELDRLRGQRDADDAANEARERALAANELVGAIADLQFATGRSFEQIASDFGFTTSDLVDALGINLEDVNGATVNELAALSNRLNVELSNLSDTLGLDLGGIFQEGTLASQAVASRIDGLPIEFRNQLAPLFASGDEAAFASAVDQLPTNLRDIFAPFLDAIDPEFDPLNDVVDNTAESVELLERIAAALEAPEILRGTPIDLSDPGNGGDVFNFRGSSSVRRDGGATATGGADDVLQALLRLVENAEQTAGNTRSTAESVDRLALKISDSRTLTP